jgi:predicted nucleic acid-binding protein
VKTAIDTNVLSALLSNEPRTLNAVVQLGKCKSEGSLVISPVVYAELHAYPNITEPFLHRFLHQTGIAVDYPLDEAVWGESGRRYALYSHRRRVSKGGDPRRLLADFVVGAHALIQADCLLTFDTAIFRRNFPELRLLPEPAQ